MPEGQRFNTGKDRWDLLPWIAVKQIVEVLTQGATKYAPRNWELGLSYNDTFASLQRHATKWFAGEDYDEESGKHHMAHVATNALFLLHFSLFGKGKDDRPVQKLGEN